jgi:hypothetical protein
MDSNLVLQIAAAFNCNNPKYLKDFDSKDPIAVNGRLTEAMFTAGVAILKKLANETLRSLMSYVWDILHHRHVTLAIGPEVPSMAFALLGRGRGQLQALIFAPTNWPEMMDADPYLQLGAIVSVGSQASDYYNGVFYDQASSILSRKRANAYEAEYLLLLRNHPLNEYQKKIVAANPNGFDPRLGYTRKPVEGTN